MATRVARFNLMFSGSVAGIRNVFRTLDSTFTRFSKSVTSLATNFVFVSEAISRIGGAVNDFRLQIDELGKVSDRFGLSSEFLQGLQLAGELTGVATDQVNDALKDFQKSLGEFQLTGARTDLFRAVGITDPGQVANAQQAFLTVVQGLEGIDDASQRAAIAAQLFGEAGQRMLLTFDTDLIQQSIADVNEWGALSRSQIASVEALNDTWTRFTAQLKITSQEALANSAEPLTILIETVGSVFGKVSGFISDIWTNFRIGVLAILETVFNALEKLFRLAERLPKVGQQFKGWGDNMRFLSDSMAKQIDDLNRSSIDIAEATRRIEQAAKPSTEAVQSGGWFNELVQGQAASLLQANAQQFATNLRDNMTAAFTRDNPLMEAALSLTGAGAIRAGSIQASQFEARNHRKTQVALLKKIERNTAQGAQPVEIIDRSL